MQNRRNTIYLIIISSLLTGLFTGRSFFFNLSYMIGGIILVSLIWSWLSVRWVSIGRRTRSSRAQVGRYLEEAFAVRNRSWIPKLWIEIRDFSDLPGHRSSHVVPALGIRGAYRWQAKTLCIARGEFRLGPMSVTSGDPFGFFVAQRQIAASSRLVVYPATVSLSKFELPVGMLSGGDAQRRRSHYVTTNASGVRDYVPGDSFNRIHWRSSARKDRLIVKEFEIDPLVDIWIFADFSATSLVEDPSVQRVDGDGPVISGSSGIPPSTEEYVVIAAASLANYFINLERAVGFASYTPLREVIQPDRGNRQLTHILESLAVARSLSPYTLGQMLTLETPYFTRGTTLLIVTSSIRTEWIRDAQILSQRGIRPLCVFVDPTTFIADAKSDELRGMLRLAKIPTIVVRKGDDLSAILQTRTF